MLGTDRCILVIACITGIFISSSLIRGCEIPYVAHDDNCYYLVTISKARWETAEESCLSHQAHLASVTSQDEYDFISRTIQGGASGKEVWIGLYRNTTAGEWKWIDGSPYSFSSWASQEPGSSDRYVRIQSGAWIGVDNSDQPYYYMCKKSDESLELESTPPSSTTTSSQQLPGPRDSRAETETTISTAQSTTTKMTNTPSTTSQTTSTQSTTATTMKTTVTTTPSTTLTSTTSPTTTSTTASTTSSTTASTTSSTTASTPSTVPSTSLSPIDTEVTEGELSSATSPHSTLYTPRNGSVVPKSSEQTRNMAIILGCVLGFLFVVIVVAIFCILARNSKLCFPKKDDDYVEPLKSANNGQSDEQVVGDILAQDQGNVYIELHDKPQQNGRMNLNDVSGMTRMTADVVQYDNDHNTMAEDNIYHSIREHDNPSRAPNPYYNT